MSSEAIYCLYSNLGYKHFDFISPITITHNRLPPAPLNLRPYGALQICLLLLLYAKFLINQKWMFWLLKVQQCQQISCCSNWVSAVI